MSECRALVDSVERLVASLPGQMGGGAMCAALTRHLLSLSCSLPPITHVFLLFLSPSHFFADTIPQVTTCQSAHHTYIIFYMALSTEWLNQEPQCLLHHTHTHTHTHTLSYPGLLEGGGRYHTRDSRVPVFCPRSKRKALLPSIV